MNFLDKFLLKLALLPASLYEKMGVDILQLRAVLTAKLTMDNRRPASFSNYKNRGEKKEINGSTLKMMLGGLLMGLIMLFTFAAGNGMVTKLSLFMTMFIFMVCITLITDFTSVLIDIRDNLIILPKPISDATFMTGRLLHIAIRTSIVVLPLSVPGCITAAIISGPLIILPFILMTILMTLLSIFFINAMYLLILKITTPAKFQNIIGAIQIVFVMIIMLAYQIMPRMVNSSIMQNISIQEISFAHFVPSYWFADGCVMLAGGGYSPGSLISLALALVVPLLSIWIVVKFFAPSFNQKLGMITGGSGEQSVAVKVSATGAVTPKKRWIQRIAALITKPGAERAGFLFAAGMMTRSRDFKLKVYPSFGSIIIICVIMLFQNHAFEGISLHSPKLHPILLLILYICSMPLSTALMQVVYTDKFKASWIFFITPLEKPGLLISGAIKCMMLVFLVPFIIPVIIIGVALLGFSTMPSFLLGGINLILIGAFLGYLLVRKLPFSTAQEGARQGNTFIRTLLFLVVPGAIGIGHWLLSRFEWVISLWILIALVAVWLLFDEIKKRSWADLK